MTESASESSKVHVHAARRASNARPYKGLRTLCAGPGQPPTGPRRRVGVLHWTAEEHERSDAGQSVLRYVPKPDAYREG
jgi:hypothetical protein